MVAELTVDLTSLPKQKFLSLRNGANQTYCEVHFEVEISATSALEYAVSIGGSRYGSITANYT